MEWSGFPETKTMVVQLVYSFIQLFREWSGADFPKFFKVKL